MRYKHVDLSRRRLSFVVALAFAQLLATPGAVFGSSASLVATPDAQVTSGCHSEPISRNRVERLRGKATFTPIPPQSPTPGPTLASRPTPDAETSARVESLVREFIGCLNAGDYRRFLSLYSDRGLIALLADYSDADVDAVFAGSIDVPRDQQIELVEIRDPLVLTVSGITVVFDVAPVVPRQPDKMFGFWLDLIFHEQRWLIDDVSLLGAFDRS